LACKEDRRLFQHFPLLAQQTDFLAKPRVLLLNVFMRSSPFSLGPMALK
jgi:hypothetical protein